MEGRCVCTLERAGIDRVYAMERICTKEVTRSEEW